MNLIYVYSMKMFDQTNIFTDQPNCIFLSEFLQKFFLYHVSFFVDSILVGIVEIQKPLSQA